MKIALHQTFPDVTKAVEAHSWRDIVKGVKVNRCKQQPKSLSKMCSIAVNGVLRLGARLQRGNLPFDLKLSAILRKRHPVTKLLVLNAHVQKGHVGIQHVLSILRYRYCTMGGAATIKHNVVECKLCRNPKAASGAPVMSLLLMCELNWVSEPFMFVGRSFLEIFS